MSERVMSREWEIKARLAGIAFVADEIAQRVQESSRHLQRRFPTAPSNASADQEWSDVYGCGRH